MTGSGSAVLKLCWAAVALSVVSPVLAHETTGLRLRLDLTVLKAILMLHRDIKPAA
jgi:hypothetical protein